MPSWAWIGLIVVVTYLILCLGLFEPIMQEKLKENWAGNRCNPLFMPVVGLSDLAEGTSYLDKTWNNLNHCTTAVATQVVSAHMNPIHNLMQGITTNVSALAGTVSGLRNMTGSMRDMFESLVAGVYSRIESLQASVLNDAERLKILIKKQSAIVEIAVQFLTFIPFVFSSFSYGPIPRFANWMHKYMKTLISFIAICLLCLFGGPFTAMVACPVCALCFHPRTHVRMSSGESKPLTELSLGDQLGSTSSLETTRVDGILNLYNCHFSDLMLYNNSTIVTGNHLVNDYGRWMRVQDSARAKPLLTSQSKPITELICLWTSDNWLETAEDGVRFADYRESSNASLWCSIQHWTKQWRNGHKMDKLLDPTALSAKQLRTDDAMKAASYIGGFLLDSDTRVAPSDAYGTFKSKVPKGSGYWYSLRGVILTGNCLVFDTNDSIWKRVYEHPEASSISISSYSLTAVHYFTKSGIISAYGDIKVADCMESSDVLLNKHIDRCLLVDRTKLS